MTPLRIALVSCALVACAWFALGARQAVDTSRASAIVGGSGSLTAGQATRARSLLSAAGTLNPDSTVDLLRGEVAYLRGRRSDATGIFRDLVRREPMNIEGWVWLARAAFPNPVLINRAVQSIARLDPKG